MTPYQQFIHKSRYARYLDDKQRRENWPETVQRFIDNVVKPKIQHQDAIDELYHAIVNLDVLPSMRAIMTAGQALDRDNTCLYNCSYLPIDDPRAFDEAMFILLCGTGVGFSVENKYIDKLPEVPKALEDVNVTITVPDSKEGWASSLRMLINFLYGGRIPKWDLKGIRPSGARLKTFGGRASGPEPLDDLFNFVVNIFMTSRGGKLTSLDCHDLMCKIGEVVVVGGVRRSAMISLSDLDDELMRDAKSGEWWKDNPQRALANNSAVYESKPSAGPFMKEWLSLYESHSGERGIFNREASQKKAAANGRRGADVEYGTNP